MPLSLQVGGSNTEKLDRHQGVEYIELPGLEGKHATIQCGAGVVTARVSENRQRGGRGVRRRSDLGGSPCIGGNVAMNAGGKESRAVGTALDNLASWKWSTRTATGCLSNIGHNYGKIHDVDVASFRVRRFAADGKTLLSENTLNIPGPSFRKVGLGKDVTDKFTAPAGRAKEGTDGIITSARFVLHRMPKHTRTVSGILWHGGRSHASDCGNHRLLQARRRRRAGWRAAGGLEHLDWRYVRAVGYATKAKSKAGPRWC